MLHNRCSIHTQHAAYCRYHCDGCSGHVQAYSAGHIRDDHGQHSPEMVVNHVQVTITTGALLFSFLEITSPLSLKPAAYTKPPILVYQENDTFVIMTPPDDPPIAASTPPISVGAAAWHVPVLPLVQATDLLHPWNAAVLPVPSQNEHPHWRAVIQWRPFAVEACLTGFHTCSPVIEGGRGVDGVWCGWSAYEQHASRTCQNNTHCTHPPPVVLVVVSQPSPMHLSPAALHSTWCLVVHAFVQYHRHHHYHHPPVDV